MSGELERVLHLLEGLDVTGLETARSKIAALQSLPQVGAPDAAATTIEIVVDAVVAVMCSVGGEQVHTSMIRKAPNYASFVDKVRALVAPILDRATQDRVSRRALAHMIVGLLYRDMERLNITVTTRTLMNNIHRAPAVLNRNFPGYAACGMLTWLIRKSPP